MCCGAWDPGSRPQREGRPCALPLELPCQCYRHQTGGALAVLGHCRGDPCAALAPASRSLDTGNHTDTDCEALQSYWRLMPLTAAALRRSRALAELHLSSGVTSRNTAAPPAPFAWATRSTRSGRRGLTVPGVASPPRRDTCRPTPLASGAACFSASVRLRASVRLSASVRLRESELAAITQISKSVCSLRRHL